MFYLFMYIFIIFSWYLCKVLIRNTENKPKRREKYYLIFIGVLLILITGLRHNMGTDYITYEYIFSHITWADLFDSKPVFNLLQLISKSIFGNNIVILMLLIAIITVYCQFKMIYKHSRYVCLSVLLLLFFGSYFTSFNTTRQFLAISIYFLGFDAILERKPFKYLIIFSIACGVHMSTIVFFPFYFVNKIKINRSMIIIMLSSIMFIYISFDNILDLIFSLNFYDNYENSSFINANRNMFFNVLRPLIVTMIYLFHLYYGFISFKKNNYKYYIIATFLYLFFSILATKAYVLYRFTYFVIPISLLGIAKIIDEYKLKENRVIWIVILVIGVFIYGLLGQFTQDYRFFWQ